MEDLATALRIQGLSEASIKIYMSSWKAGTTKQYDVYLEKWTKFCVEQKIHPGKPTKFQVMEFCTHLYHQKLSYSSINLARSALSAYVHKIDGMTVGAHPDVCRHLKGVAVSRPGGGRYTHAWDADVVLVLMKSWYPLDKLTYQQLAYKTLMLLALTTAQRLQTLHAFSLDSITWSSDEVVLGVDKLLKHTREGQSLDVFHVFKYEDKRLCPFRTLRVYLDRTAHMRVTKDNKKLNKLWLSVAGADHSKKEVTQQTLAHWLKNTMKQAGINSNVFKAHSTRAAATSKAYWAELPTDYILKQARWTNAVTFARFYKRPILQQRGSNFQDTVLRLRAARN